MAEDDGAVAQMLMVCDRINDGGDAVVLPVEAIPVRYTWNRPVYACCAAGEAGI